MKKIHTILTIFIIIVLIVHGIYMVLTFMNIVPRNEDLSQNMGFTLMYAAILHGLLGLPKLIVSTLHLGRIPSANRISLSRQTRAGIVTILQRLFGLVILAVIIPHTNIKVMTSDPIWLVIDIVFIVALVIHLGIGFPKLMVSLGLGSDKSLKKERIN